MVVKRRRGTVEGGGLVYEPEPEPVKAPQLELATAEESVEAEKKEEKPPEEDEETKKYMELLEKLEAAYREGEVPKDVYERLRREYVERLRSRGVEVE